MKLKGLPLNSVIVRFVGVMLIVLALPFCAVLVWTTNRLSTMEKENANQYLSSNLRTVSSTVDQVLRNLEFSYTSIFIDNQFLNAVKRLSPYDTREEYSDFRNTNGIKNCIGRVAATNDYIDSIYAYSFTAKRMFSSRINWDPKFNHFGREDSAWLGTYYENKLGHPWYITREVRDDRAILSSYREIWVYGDDSPIGLLSVNIDERDITRMLGEVTPNGSGYSFIIDGKGDVITVSARDDVFDEIIGLLPSGMDEGFLDFTYGGQNLFVSYYTSSYSGFKYVLAMSMDQIQTSVPVMTQLIILFLVLLGLLVVLALVLAGHYFFKPVTALFTGMKRVRDGDFSARLPQNPTYEFSYINRNFNQMVENIQILINENYANKLVYKEAQLQNIQNQLNEHFLYNTLDSIHWLARLENAPQVCDMVFALASFYRLSLSSGKDVIPVGDVIEMLKNYLFIQKFRMRDSLNYKIDCDPGLLDVRIPKNLLQPIVENAVLHGIKNLSRPGVVEVLFERRGGHMHVSVKDDGNGFTGEQLTRVKEQLALKDPYCEHSFALKTVQSQLRIYYDADIALNIDTALGEGSDVWFDLPLI